MAIKAGFVVSLYLDKRRTKKGGKFPVKLRVYDSSQVKTKQYATLYNLTEQEFASAWASAKPRKEFKELRLELQALENRANNIAENLSPFSFDAFERKLFRSTGDGGNVFYQYNETIDRLKANEQLGTASNYELSLKSLKNYLVHKTGRESKKLLFNEITPEWLSGYENYMLKVMGRSRTTVSMYVRALRTIFNNAISENEIDPALYPFGKKKYKVPAQKKVKKALTMVELKALFSATPRTPEQEKAKDFWFFSYTCNGINVKDIALLRNENIQGEKLVLYRAKTINTSKENLEPIVLFLTDYAKGIIKKYGTRKRGPKELVFDIIHDGLSAEVRHSKIKNFTRYINQNLKKLALAEGITGDISSNWGRHSFATNAIRNGASIELIREALNHSNVKTTQGYMAGFEESQKKELSEKLMDF